MSEFMLTNIPDLKKVSQAVCSGWFKSIWQEDDYWNNAAFYCAYHS